MKDKKKIIDGYMKYYNEVIDDTIKAHNEQIYGDLKKFLLNTTSKLKIAATKICLMETGRLGNLASNI